MAIIGRPNVGKSTLVNRLLGEERVIASDKPGTTRDSIMVPFERDGRDFMLVDTAGLRRRAKVEDAVERVSVARTLQAIAEAHAVVVVLDAHDSVGEQDASVLGQALERGRVLLIAVNNGTASRPTSATNSPALSLSSILCLRAAALHLSAPRHGCRRAGARYRAWLRLGHESHVDAAARGPRARHRSAPTLVRAAASAAVRAPGHAHHASLSTIRPWPCDAYRRYPQCVSRRVRYATPVAIDFRGDANPYVRLKAGKRRARPAGTMPGRRKRG